MCCCCRKEAHLLCCACTTGPPQTWRHTTACKTCGNQRLVHGARVSRDSSLGCQCWRSACRTPPGMRHLRALHGCAAQQHMWSGQCVSHWDTRYATISSTAGATGPHGSSWRFPGAAICQNVSDASCQYYLLGATLQGVTVDLRGTGKSLHQLQADDMTASPGLFTSGPKSPFQAYVPGQVS